MATARKAATKRSAARAATKGKATKKAGATTKATASKKAAGSTKATASKKTATPKAAATKRAATRTARRPARKPAARRAGAGPVIPVEEVEAVLGQVFPGAELGRLARKLTTRHVPAGEVVCSIGDVAETAWLVVRGRLRVLGGQPGAQHAVSDVGPGMILGERGLIEDGVRSATIVARRDAVVTELTREWLSELIGQEPSAIGHFATSLGSHIDVLDATEQVITLVPAGVGQDVVDELVAMLATMPRTVVTPQSAVQNRQQLLDLETSGDRVVLVADPEPTAWTSRAVLLADRVVSLVDATAAGLHENDALIAGFEESALGARSAVFIHPPATAEPHGTRDLLARLSVEHHLHMRAHHERDMGRVARHLSGNAIGLVVSGGGARALGAIGLHRELRRLGIPIDAVTGSSAGAVIAAAIARGVEPDELLRRCRDGFQKLRDPTLPVASLLRGGRLWDRLGEQFGSLDIEDTWIPFACTSTDLTDQALVHHVRGPIRQAVRASVSLPGVFPPLDIDGHLHVDGGILDNLPVRAMDELGTDLRLIAFDVSAPSGPVADNLAPVVSGVAVMLHRLLRRTPLVIPSITSTLTQSALLSASRTRRESLQRVDCHIDLALDQYALLDFSRIDTIVDESDRRSAPILSAWLDGDGASVVREEPWEPSIDVEAEGDPELEATTARAVLGSLGLAIADLRFRLRRFMVAMGAAAVVLALLLLMTGVVNELDREPSVTADTIGATTWILPDGIESPFTSNATFDESVLAGVVSDGTVRPALIARLPVTIDGETLDAILIGHAADGPGRPKVDDGRAADVAGELAISRFSGAETGDQIGLGSTTATVTGTMAGTTLFAGMPIVFTPIDAARGLVAGGRPVASAVLVDGDVTAVPPGLHALTRGEIIAGAKGPVERPILTLHLVQALLAIVAAMIIGAVVYLASLERTRDIAVLRAVGTTGAMLAIGVAAQALVVAVVAAVLAAIIETLLAPAFPLTVHLTVRDFVLLPVIAIIVAVAASYVAIRRTLRIDPSDAFAGAGG